MKKGADPKDFVQCFHEKWLRIVQSRFSLQRWLLAAWETRSLPFFHNRRTPALPVREFYSRTVHNGQNDQQAITWTVPFAEYALKFGITWGEASSGANSCGCRPDVTNWTLPFASTSDTLLGWSLSGNESSTLYGTRYALSRPPSKNLSRTQVATSKSCGVPARFGILARNLEYNNLKKAKHFAEKCNWITWGCFQYFPVWFLLLVWQISLFDESDCQHHQQCRSVQWKFLENSIYQLICWPRLNKKELTQY